MSNIALSLFDSVTGTKTETVNSFVARISSFFFHWNLNALEMSSKRVFHSVIKSCYFIFFYSVYFRIEHICWRMLSFWVASNKFSNINSYTAPYQIENTFIQISSLYLASFFGLRFLSLFNSLTKCTKHLKYISIIPLFDETKVSTISTNFRQLFRIWCHRSV